MPTLGRSGCPRQRCVQVKPESMSKERMCLWFISDQKTVLKLCPRLINEMITILNQVWIYARYRPSESTACSVYYSIGFSGVYQLKVLYCLLIHGQVECFLHILSAREHSSSKLSATYCTLLHFSIPLLSMCRSPGLHTPESGCL